MKKYFVVEAQAWKTIVVELDMDDSAYSMMSEDELEERIYEMADAAWPNEEAEIMERFEEGDRSKNPRETMLQYQLRHGAILAQ